MPKSPRLYVPVLRSPVAVIGDIMCDHYVWGDVDRISPEAPVQVLKWDREAHRAGGAANAAMNLAALGCKVRLVGLVGRDEPGNWLLQTLQAAGIDVGGVVRSRERPTALKTRIIGRGQHILRIDRERSGPVGAQDERQLAAAVRSARRRTAAVVCSDYNKGVLSPGVLRTALDGESPLTIVDPKGRDYNRYRGASLLTPNEKELMDASQDDDVRSKDDDVIAARAETMMRRLAIGALVVTRGAHGMDVFERGDGGVKRSHIPAAQTQEVFDVTGAGDTVVAGLTLGLAGGMSLVNAARLANLAAGIVVRKVGTAVAERAALERAVRALAPRAARR